MQEEWRDIVIEKNGVIYDYTGLYQVSNLGQVRSLNYRGHGSTKIMKPSKNSDGYEVVQLYKNKKYTQFQVHRLVATMFIDNPNNLPVVNHLDEVKTNNCVDNLEWCTIAHNVRYSTLGTKRTQEAKSKMGKQRMKKVRCVETGDIFNSIKDANLWCGLSTYSSSISNCCKNSTKTAGGYHWQYVD